MSKEGVTEGLFSWWRKKESRKPQPLLSNSEKGMLRKVSRNRRNNY